MLTPRARPVVVVLHATALLALGSAGVVAQQAAPSDPVASLDAVMAAAESGLRQQEYEIAESRYRQALAQAWILMGALEAAENRLEEARDAFTHATESAVDARVAQYFLALTQLQLQDADAAHATLSTLVRANPADIALRRLLAQALVAAGRPAEALQELEEARAAAPDDLELTFATASGYLSQKKIDRAEHLFDELIKARPLPATHVLIGRAYRDAGEYARAQMALEAALEKDPQVRRAHYYLGTIHVMAEGSLQLDAAIREFEQELALSPKDPAASLGLGLALVHARRFAEALPHLDLATTSNESRGDAFYYLGRCLLGLNRAGEAVTALRTALQSSEGSANVLELRSVHYQLGLALRELGQTEEAARHFAEAERSLDKRIEGDRARLTRFLSDAPEPLGVGTFAPGTFTGGFPFADAPPEQRRAIVLRVREALARAYLNLGIMQARGGRFARAAGFFESAAGVDPAFPQVQFSLGVAHFNAKAFQKATEPLSRARAADPANGEIRRMLALAWLNVNEYSKAADLLRDDPKRASDPSLQYAYGLALARSGRTEEAEAVFSQLIASAGESPDVHVVLGQAHAQQGDVNAAIASLQKAIELKPDVAEAHGALGVIFLKQGRLQESADVLAAGAKVRPDDLPLRQTLATVLDFQGKRDEALAMVRSLVASNPDLAEARYLLGKILLAQGAAQDALEHLQVAVKLAPDEANHHYQLGQAYQKLGRADLAEAHFERFREIKDKRRGGTP